MIDIHNHSLYQVDDGAKSYDETIAMLKEARRQGVTDIIMTPHFRHGMFPYEKRRIEENFIEARDAADFIGVNLYLGCEYHVDLDLVDHLLDGRIHSLGDTDFVLCEFSHVSLPGKIRQSMQDVIRAGYVPVIAHVERYDAFLKDYDFCKEMKDQGAMLQINADAVIGLDGRPMKKFCKEVIKRGLVDFVASDAHGIENRPMHMAEAKKYVEKKFGERMAEFLFEQNAECILAGI